MTIIVEQKSHYGNIFFYPVCDRAKGFAKLAGKKTLTFEAIRLIKKLGYTIEVKQEKVVL